MGLSKGFHWYSLFYGSPGIHFFTAVLYCVDPVNILNLLLAFLLTAVYYNSTVINIKEIGVFCS